MVIMIMEKILVFSSTSSHLCTIKVQTHQEEEKDSHKQQGPLHQNSSPLRCSAPARLKKVHKTTE